MNRHDFVRNPSKDFTRNRKISFRILIEILITMGASSQNKELLEFYKFNVQLPTASASIQQRDKLKPSALLYVLQEFINSLGKMKTYKCYRLLAIDGSKITIFKDPNNKETFVITNQYSVGCNFLHLNALFDISNKVYLDATIQTYSKANEFKALVELIKRSPLKKDVIL